MGNELREWYKEHGICTICHHENALNGRTYCIVCKARVITYNQDNWMKQKEKRNPINKEHNRKVYQERKQAGICTRCGKNKPEAGKAKCTRCLVKDRKAHEIGRYTSRSDWMKQGICYTCGKSPCLKGKKICQSCYDKSLKSLEKARTFIKSGWRFGDFKFGKYDKPERSEQK